MKLLQHIFLANEIKSDTRAIERSQPAIFTAHFLHCRRPSVGKLIAVRSDLNIRIKITTMHKLRATSPSLASEHIAGKDNGKRRTGSCSRYVHRSACNLSQVSREVDTKKNKLIMLHNPGQRSKRLRRPGRQTRQPGHTMDLAEVSSLQTRLGPAGHEDMSSIAAQLTRADRPQITSCGPTIG
jgi:hypothetical protein